MISSNKRICGAVIYGGLFAVLALSAFGMVGLLLGALQPSPVLGSTVTVSATVPSTISCSVSTTTTSFGTITSAAIATASLNVTSTMACDDAIGCTFSINDAGDGTHGGLYSSGASYLVPSPDAAYDGTATLVAGTEGFGIQAATTSAGSGATFTIGSNYLQTGDTVGKLATTTATLASTNAPTTGRQVVVTHLAAISTLTSAATDYSDTITYGCTSN